MSIMTLPSSMSAPNLYNPTQEFFPGFDGFQFERLESKPLVLAAYSNGIANCPSQYFPRHPHQPFASGMHLCNGMSLKIAPDTIPPAYLRGSLNGCHGMGPFPGASTTSCPSATDAAFARPMSSPFPSGSGGFVSESSPMSSHDLRSTFSAPASPFPLRLHKLEVKGLSAFSKFAKELKQDATASGGEEDTSQPELQRSVAKDETLSKSKSIDLPNGESDDDGSEVLESMSPSSSETQEPKPKIPSSIRPFVCAACSQTFADSAILQGHIKLKHSAQIVLQERKVYQCKQCGAACESKAKLKQHEGEHRTTKMHACGLCGFSCRSRQNLARHRLTHSKEKLYKCHMCTFGANRKEDLEEHVNSHLGVKPYKCQQCTFETCYRGSLRNHLKLHTSKSKFYTRQQTKETEDE